MTKLKLAMRITQRVGIFFGCLALVGAFLAGPPWTKLSDGQSLMFGWIFAFFGLPIGLLCGTAVLLLKAYVRFQEKD